MARTTNSMIAAALAGFLLTGGVAVAGDYGQLAAAAGLSPSEASGLTLPQITAHFFNHGAEIDEQQPVPGAAASAYRVSSREMSAAQLAAAAGLSPSEARGMSLSQIAAHFFNHGADNDELQPVPAAAGQARVSTRDFDATGGRNAQLIAAAGLSPEEAAGMSLQQIAAAFTARSTDAE